MSTRIAAVIFIAAIATANLLVAEFGPWFSPINAFVLIGLDLSLRDWLHDRWRDQLWKMGALIATAGVLSYVLNPAAGRIAVASVVAFTLAATFDALVYHRLIDRRWMVRANGSNLAGAGVDSIAFPLIAFGWFPGLLAVMGLQFAAKVSGGFLWALALNPWRGRRAAPAHQG
jgi:queuosine precursor transporter